MSRIFRDSRNAGLLDMLTRPATTAELAARMNRCPSSIRRTMKALHTDGLIRIADWSWSTRGWIPVWALGNQGDAIKPTDPPNHPVRKRKRKRSASEAWLHSLPRPVAKLFRQTPAPNTVIFDGMKYERIAA